MIKYNRLYIIILISLCLFLLNNSGFSENTGDKKIAKIEKNIIPVIFDKNLKDDFNYLKTDTETFRPKNWGNLDLDSKVDWLLSHMTLSEKVEQLNIQPEKSKNYKGLGSRSQIWNKRLGIGPILATNGPRGPRSSGEIPATRTTGYKGPVSPTGHALASTWNTELLQEVGKQWGFQTKEYGLNTLWGPGINIIKDPRSGRNTDYASEDPYLTGAYGTAITKGLQSVGVAAVIKHLVANNWESGRQSHNVEVPIRPLRELYFTGFRMAVEEGNAMGIMTCYNSLNGVWGSSSKWLLTDVVRNEWGFKGFFVSDWGALHSSVAQTLRSGQNLELPGQSKMNLFAVKTSLNKGEITMSDINARVREILKFKLGRLSYFGEGTPSGYKTNVFSDVMRCAGDESLVLLKNKDSILPLKKSQSVALIGPFADNEAFIVGNAGSSTVYPSYVVTVRNAMLTRGIHVNYTQGGDNAFTYKNAKYQNFFPCTINYFNGLDLAGPVVSSVKAKKLILNTIEAGGTSARSIPDGFKGKCIYSSGKIRISPMYTPEGPWTVRVQLRLEDQLPKSGCSIMRFFADKQVLQVGSSEFLVDVGDVKKNNPLDWNNIDKRWIDLVVSYDGNNVIVYREGKMISQVSGIGHIDSQQIIFGYNSQGLPMDVDELQIWDTSLTPAKLVDEKALTTESFDFFEVDKKINVGILGINDTRDMSLRAISSFTPLRPGKVGFQIETSGGVRVFIDDKLVYDLNDEQKAAGTKNLFWHVFTDTQSHKIVVEYSSKQKYGKAGYLRLSYVQPPASSIFAEAISAASVSDIAVVCVGVPSDQQAENIDRPRIELPSWQDELVLAVRKVNPNTVVLLFTEGGVDVRKWIDIVPAVIESFHPGSEGGNIIADVLYGDVNPSGKLTTTWPKKNEDLPVSGPNTHYKNTINEFGYRYFDAKSIEPMFPFGYGLSYTTFKYINIKVKKTSLKFYPVSAWVTVKNTGKVAGKEVVQVYVSDNHSKVEQSVKELAGFKKVALNPGESKEVEVPLYWTAFQYFNTKSGKWTLDPGGFRILAGTLSSDKPVETRIYLK